MTVTETELSFKIAKKAMEGRVNVLKSELKTLVERLTLKQKQNIKRGLVTPMDDILAIEVACLVVGSDDFKTKLENINKAQSGIELAKAYDELLAMVTGDGTQISDQINIYKLTRKAIDRFLNDITKIRRQHRLIRPEENLGQKCFNSRIRNLKAKNVNLPDSVTQYINEDEANCPVSLVELSEPCLVTVSSNAMKNAYSRDSLVQLQANDEKRLVPLTREMFTDEDISPCYELLYPLAVAELALKDGKTSEKAGKLAKEAAEMVSSFRETDKKSEKYDATKATKMDESINQAGAHLAETLKTVDVDSRKELIANMLYAYKPKNTFENMMVFLTRKQSREELTQSLTDAINNDSIKADELDKKVDECILKLEDKDAKSFGLQGPEGSKLYKALKEYKNEFKNSEAKPCVSQGNRV